jgi:hypothetical protein
MRMAMLLKRYPKRTLLVLLGLVADLSSAIGNQYIREGKVFTLEQPGSFF